MCNIKSTRKVWSKPPPKDTSAAESDLLALARAQQQAEDSSCKLPPPPSYTPTYSYRWDHTLGYEGEGPPLHLVSLNSNGVLSNATWSKLLDLAQFLQVDILCLQETKIAVGDVRLASLEATATHFGFMAYIGLKPAASDRSGTAILARIDANNLSISSHGFARSGRTTYVDIALHSHAVRVLSLPLTATHYDPLPLTTTLYYSLL